MKNLLKKLFNKIVNIWDKMEDTIGYIIFLLALIITSPLFMLYGAIVTPIRFYQHVSSVVHGRESKRYTW